MYTRMIEIGSEERDHGKRSKWTMTTVFDPSCGRSSSMRSQKLRGAARASLWNSYYPTVKEEVTFPRHLSFLCLFFSFFN